MTLWCFYELLLLVWLYMYIIPTSKNAFVYKPLDWSILYYVIIKTDIHICIYQFYDWSNSYHVTEKSQTMMEIPLSLHMNFLC